MIARHKYNVQYTPRARLIWTSHGCKTESHAWSDTEGLSVHGCWTRSDRVKLEGFNQVRRISLANNTNSSTAPHDAAAGSLYTRRVLDNSHQVWYLCLIGRWCTDRLLHAWLLCSPPSGRVRYYTASRRIVSALSLFEFPVKTLNSRNENR